MSTAIDKLEEISADERMIEKYRAREKSRRDMIWLRVNAENRAKEAGMKQGLEQGIVTGKKVVARKLLDIGLPINQIVEATDLTIEKVMELQKEIEK